MTAPRVLLVEDNHITQKLTVALLHSAGYAVVCTDSAEEGLEMAKAEPPQLILMDIRLPGMDGLSATSILKRDPVTANIPILAYTAFAMRGDAEKAYDAGCDFYITKPINTRQFLETIGHFMARQGFTPPPKAPRKGSAPRVAVAAPAGCAEAVRQALAPLGVETRHAASSQDALDILGPDLDLAILDMGLAGGGLDILRRIRTNPCGRELPVLVICPYEDIQARRMFQEAGADDFLAKPVDELDLRMRCKSLLRLKAAQDQAREHERELESRIGEKTESMRRAVTSAVTAKRRLLKANIESIERLALAAEYRDDDTGRHIQRIGLYCELIARGLSLSRSEVWQIRMAGPMHDIGKIGIPDHILLKAGPLTTDEREIMKRHAVIGARILGGSDSEIMSAGELVARTHHERFDGTGYPAGLSGTDIPVFGRICAVADVFDALTSRRPYKQPLPVAQAVEVMLGERARHFDPAILDAFLANLAEIESIRMNYPD